MDKLSQHLENKKYEVTLFEESQGSYILVSAKETFFYIFSSEDDKKYSILDKNNNVLCLIDNQGCTETEAYDYIDLYSPPDKRILQSLIQDTWTTLLPNSMNFILGFK